MNYTKVITVVLAGIMAVAPVQYTGGGQLRQETEDTVSVSATEKTVTGDMEIEGLSLLMNNYYNSIAGK